MFDAVAYLATKGYRGRAASGGREMVYPCFLDCEEPPDSRKRKLYVNVEEGIYQCKVCTASGGPVTLQRHFGDDPKSGSSDDAFTRRRILDWAAKTGAEMLLHRDDVMLYLLRERGLGPQTIIDRKIGFVGSGWSLTGSLPAEFTREQLAATGLVHKSGHRSGTDFYTNHLLIPLISRGHVIQIRGRAWGETRGGKYMSGPGEEVRAWGVDSLDGAEEAILCEGEFDAIRLAEVLAACPDERAQSIAVIGLPGTNAWPDDLDDRLAGIKRLYVGFDSDKPGQSAGERLKDRFGARARLVQLPLIDEIKCDWTEYLLPVPDDADTAWRTAHPYAGHGAADVLRLMSQAAGRRIHSVAEAGAAFREYRARNTGLQTGWYELDAVLHPGLLPGQVMFMLAKTGCLSGDTLLTVNRGLKAFKVTLADLYRRFNGFDTRGYNWDPAIPTYVQRNIDGVVRLARLKEAWSSGVLRTYTVTTAGGRSIRATDMHPFLTEDGWLTLAQLQPGTRVMVNTGRSSVGRTRPGGSYIRRAVPRHPYRGRRGPYKGGNTVVEHRLVVEADLNGLTLDAYLALLRDEGTDISRLQFLNPRQWVVHHLDHDPRNNDPANLAMMTHAAHRLLHSREGHARHCLEQVGLDTVTAITPHGYEPTYDLTVWDEPHSFIAEGFVVQNTGKTLLLCNMAYQMRQYRILLISLEMTREEVYHRLQRIYLFHNPLAKIAEMEADLARIWICDENRLGEKDISILVSEYEVETGARPDLVMVDYLGYYARGARGSSPYEKATNAAMQLKADAKGNRLVIVAPAQVNRMAKDGKPIDLDDARDSGAIEETGDFVVAAFRPDAALQADGSALNVRPTYKMKLSVLKSRHGGVGKTIALQMDALTLAIVEDGTRAAKRAEEHNAMAWQGYTWDDLRNKETAPVQQKLHGKGMS